MSDLGTQATVNLAMPVTDYGTVVETTATAFLNRHCGWTVVSPNSPEHQAGYEAEGMVHFERIVASCDALAFVCFSDEIEGTAIGAGVAKEILTAMVHGRRVFDLEYDREDELMYPRELTGGQLHGRILTIAETRARIAAIREARP